MVLLLKMNTAPALKLRVFRAAKPGLFCRKKGFVVRHEDGFAGVGDEFGFSEGTADV